MEQQQHGSLLSPPELSPLEQEVLEEYERLSTNMKTVRIPNTTTQISQWPYFSIYLKPCQMLMGWDLRVSAGDFAGQSGVEPNRRDFGRAAGAGAQDELGVYAAQGECVQYCAAAGD